MPPKNLQVLGEPLVQQTDRERPFGPPRELIGLITGGTGVFVALLYLAGRSFASGYFAAMNIPDYQVRFSLWEYGVVAWLPLLLYPIGIIVISGLFWGIVAALWDRLKQKLMLKLPLLQFPEISREARRWFVIAGFAFIAFLLILMIIFTLQFVTQSGEVSGQTMVLKRAAQVEVISAIPLALDDDNLASIQSSGRDYYIYKDLHLLTFNDEKYYLFRTIDPATCKPLKVYVINAEQNIQVNLFPAATLAARCQDIARPKESTTPTP